MPKMKTHRGAAKRFKATGKGRLKHKQPYHQPHFDQQDRQAQAAAAAAGLPVRRRDQKPQAPAALSLR